MSGNETANKGFVIQLTYVNPFWVRFDTRTQESFTHISDARIDTRCRARIGDEMEPAATELEQVFGKDVSAGNIVDSYEVKFAPEGGGSESSSGSPEPPHIRL